MVLQEHTIVNRGNEYKNMSCAVCLFIKKNYARRENLLKPRRTPYWCPHPDCEVHCCHEHRNEVHSYSKEGISLKHFHKTKRVEYTRAHPGQHKKPRGSGRKS